MLSCIILAAGLSTRFGSPKALAKLNGETVIEHIQKTLIDSHIDELIFVLGNDADNIKVHLLKHKKVHFVYNKDYNLGQTSSLQAGLKAVSAKAQGFMVLPVDASFIETSTFDRLGKIFLEKNPLILIPTYGDKKGHPPMISSRLKEDLLKWDVAAGLNAFQQLHQDNIVLVEVDDPGITWSFNTLQEFENLKAVYRNPKSR